MVRRVDEPNETPMPPDYLMELEAAQPVCGVDEVGRGPWAGPVVAAAVMLDPGCIPDGLDDSKKVPAARREELAAALAGCARVGLGVASVEEIDVHNILQASFLAMRRAIQALAAERIGLVLVDGNKAPDLGWPARAVIGGDGRCLSIAAASIVAKVARDRMMRQLADAHPGYGWETNMGYGVRAHAEGLARLGVTPHHRRSFKPVQIALSRG